MESILRITEKNPITLCTAAVGIVGYTLLCVALRPASFLTQLPLLILPAFDILLQQGVSSSVLASL